MTSVLLCHGRSQPFPFVFKRNPDCEYEAVKWITRNRPKTLKDTPIPLHPGCDALLSEVIPTK